MGNLLKIDNNISGQEKICAQTDFRTNTALISQNLAKIKRYRSSNASSLYGDPSVMCKENYLAIECTKNIGTIHFFLQKNKKSYVN